MDARPGGFGPPMDKQDSHRPTGPSVEDIETDIDTDLERLRDLPLDEQVGVFASIHGRLTQALAVTGGPGNIASGNDAPGNDAPGSDARGNGSPGSTGQGNNAAHQHPNR